MVNAQRLLISYYVSMGIGLPDYFGFLWALRETGSQTGQPWVIDPERWYENLAVRALCPSSTYGTCGLGPVIYLP